MERLCIISVDGHVTGSREQFRPYVERKHLGAFEEWSGALDAIGLQTLGNLHPDADPAMQWDSSRRLADLESVGVVGEVLFPNGVPFQLASFVDVGDVDADLRRQSLVVYNRWLADFCADAPGRRAGQVLVSFDDVGQAVADVHWAAEHGLRGVVMPALEPGSRYFFDPALDPVWAAVQETGLMLSQHGGTGSPQYDPPGYAALMTLALEHSFYSGRSLWQLMYGGVFDRFPALQVAFVETEADWIGRALQKMHKRLQLADQWARFADFLGREQVMQRSPLEYWATNCHVGLSPFSTLETPLDDVVGDAGTRPDGGFCFGSDRSLFGVDYPHFEAIWPGTHDAVRQLLEDPRVSDTDASAILYGNAARLYGFDLEALRPVIERVGFTREDITRAAPTS